MKDGQSASQIAAYEAILSEDVQEARNYYKSLGIILDVEKYEITLDAVQSEIFDNNNVDLSIAGNLSPEFIQLVNSTNQLDNPDAHINNPHAFPLRPTFFFLPSNIGKTDEPLKTIRGQAVGVDAWDGTGYGIISLIERDKATLAHELGHLLGLADTGNRHHDELAFHLLMKHKSEYTAKPVSTSKRFSVEGVRWLLAPRSDRSSFTNAKRLIEKY